MKEAIVFVNRTQTSILTTREEVLKEMNQFKAFWLSSVGDQYSNQNGSVVIKIFRLTDEDRKWFASRMRG